VRELGRMPAMWRPIESESEAKVLAAELDREGGPGTDGVAVARREDQDDVLFLFDDGRAMQVHLTWTVNRPGWPHVTYHRDLEAWREASDSEQSDGETIAVTHMQVRPAQPTDAVAATYVLRRSIRELCVADHRGEASILDAWLANKTPDTFVEWLAQEDQAILIAEQDGVVLAVGGVRRPDEILLNYVRPEARFQGVSKALLAAMEAELAKSGATRAKLVSTETAKAFYQAAGYTDLGFTDTQRVGGYAMSKAFRP
jgi:GNAT superfamily N-acetyltransferase